MMWHINKRKTAEWDEVNKEGPNPSKTRGHCCMSVLLLFGLAAIIAICIYVGIDKATSDAPKPESTTWQPTTLLYTAENTIAEAGELFVATVNVSVPSGSNAFSVMQLGAESNPLLRFNHTWFDVLGASIQEINGVKVDYSKELFWSFKRRNSTYLCLHNVGVSTYIPSDGEEIYFSMERYSIFEEVPNCVNRKTESHVKTNLVLYTAKNTISEAGELFSASVNVSVPIGSNAFSVMEQGAGSNSLLSFNYTLFDGLGASINEINGVEADHSKELFWAFMKRNATDLCLHNVGVSTYIPSDGEELYFSMAKYSIFEEVANCDTAKTEPHVNLVWYTAENTISEAGELFSASVNVSVPTGSTAFSVMQMGAGSNSLLRFNYTIFDGLGASINEINGVEVDHSKELFWTFMKRNATDLCLHNVGVSTYIPSDGEELYFSMAKYSIFEEVPNCITAKSEPHDVQTTVASIL